MCCYRRYRFKYARVILCVASICFFTACNSENRESFAISSSLRSYESRIVDSYTKYINEISTPDLPLSSFLSSIDSNSDTAYIHKVFKDDNLQFFPSTLWQNYSLNGKSDWKERAEFFSELVSESDISYFITNGELIQNVFLTPYLITGDREYYSSLIKLLSGYVSYTEGINKTVYNSESSSDTCIGKLLENQVLFFASRETGDPVFRDLALSQSEHIFGFYFDNAHANELYYGLANWNTIPDITELEKLNDLDYYNLALCFYGFTFLNNERENEKYYNLSLRLAQFFISLFEAANRDSKEVRESEAALAKKIDFTSRAMVCLALSNLSSDSSTYYNKVSNDIFKGIMDDLERSQGHNKEQYSFRMYYYLFEYLRQNQDLSLLSKIN